MVYGYYNAFITMIDESVPDSVAELEKVAENVITETLSYRPELNELIDRKLKEGDTLYVLSFARFCSGLRDLDCLLTEIVDEKKVRLISIRDDFDSATPEGTGARKAFNTAVSLINADPNHGFYK